VDEYALSSDDPHQIHNTKYADPDDIQEMPKQGKHGQPLHQPGGQATPSYVEEYRQ
jgi:hypothetical protein